MLLKKVVKTKEIEREECKPKGHLIGNQQRCNKKQQATGNMENKKSDTKAKEMQIKIKKNEYIIEKINSKNLKKNI